MKQGFNRPFSVYISSVSVSLTQTSLCLIAAVGDLGTTLVSAPSKSKLAATFLSIKTINKG